MLLDSPEECVAGQDYINDSDLTIKLLSLFKVPLIILYQFFVDSVKGIVGMLSFIQIADGEEKGTQISLWKDRARTRNLGY